MDTAKTFKPHTILLWNKVADDPEAKRIVELFPKASVKIIEHQRIESAKNTSLAQALRNGKRTLMIGQTSSYLGQFDGRLGHSVRCCPYYKLVPSSNGCPYFCTYCYLAFVYRKYMPFIKLNINYETMFKQISKAAHSTENHADFNMGEMLDSLALDHITNLTSKLIPFFGNLSNAYLMLLTKSSNIDNLLEAESNTHVVISWSLNSQRLIDQYEPGTADLTERINAAKLCQKHGYRIRFRIDPGILYPNWKDEYADFIQQTLKATEPENITLGMLRLLPGHKKLAEKAYGQRGKKLASVPLVAAYSDGKLRYDSKKRIQFYSFLIDTIRSLNPKVSIGLCRETPQIWQAFKNICKPHKCNCVTW